MMRHVSASRCQPLVRLGPNERGAVFILGAFMALFLVGSLWYVIGLGDAILFRERMQDGTDAVAFTAAVYHARGMNMIASLNIILSVLLGLVIAAKMLAWLNNFVLGLAVLCAWAVPVCTSVAAVTAKLKTPLGQIADKTEAMYDAVGPAINGIQHFVALSTPWYAEYQSAIATRDYQPDVSGGLMVSLSLAPGALTGERRVGLPVERGKPTDLCARTSQGIVSLMFRPFGALGGAVRDLIGDTLEDGVSAFCEDNGKKLAKLGNKVADKRITKAAREHCNWESKVTRKIHEIRTAVGTTAKGMAREQRTRPLLNQLSTLAYETGPTLKPKRTERFIHPCAQSPISHMFRNGSQRPGDAESMYASDFCPRPRPILQYRSCLKRMKKRFRAKFEKQTKRTKRKKKRPQTVPYIVFRKSAPGGAHFQIYGMAWADLGRVKDDAPIVAVAHHGSPPPDRISALASQSFAAAEFYYDGKYDPLESMWNLRWRATLRRFWPPSAEDVPFARRLLDSGALQKISGQVQAALGSAADQTRMEDGMGLMLGDNMVRTYRAQSEQARNWVNDPETMATVHYGPIH